MIFLTITRNFSIPIRVVGAIVAVAAIIFAAFGLIGWPVAALFVASAFDWGVRPREERRR